MEHDKTDVQIAESSDLIVDSFELREDLEGRINNLALSQKSQGSVLIPLFEAIMNGLHSIQDKFGDEWAKSGMITVEAVTDENGNPVSFQIEDNGVGLDEDNFKSFRTYDSMYKRQKGGKGVGRLTWLKVFDSIKVQSVFFNGRQSCRRNFSFALKARPIFGHSLDVGVQDPQKTYIKLANIKDGYKSSCPRELDTLAKKVIAHFLPFLIANDCPHIELHRNAETLSLKTLLEDHKVDTKSDKFEILDVGTFEIRHVLLDKTLIEGKADHKIYFAAHDRIVSENSINNQMGLDNYFDYNGRKVGYVGIVSSPYLDSAVTQERTKFDVDKETFKQIAKLAEESAKVYLDDPIQEIVKQKSESVSKVIGQFPRYKYLVGNNVDFAKELPLNIKSEEDIYRELSVYDFRDNRSLSKEIKAVAAPANSSEEDDSAQQELSERFDKVLERISNLERSDLAQYVVRRKAIIDLLDTRLGKDENNQKYREDVIHKIICPMRVTSQDVTIDMHNLWLLDDRLAFYNFWASDKAIKTYVRDSSNTDRPDLVLFQGCGLLQRPKTAQPVVIVEFKRPARDDYSDEENPILQIYGYMKELRAKKVDDKDGKLITEISEDTPFFCYVVCDITMKLEETLKNFQINKPLPGGRGFFGYHPDNNAYIEVINYSKLVDDARLRHEAFFKELGIN